MSQELEQQFPNLFLFDDAYLKQLQKPSSNGPRSWTAGKTWLYGGYLYIPHLAGGTRDLSDRLNLARTIHNSMADDEDPPIGLVLSCQPSFVKHFEEVVDPALLPLDPNQLPFKYDQRDDFYIDNERKVVKKAPVKVGPVRLQGYCASCVAFGATAAVEVAARRMTGDSSLPDLSPAQLFFDGGGPLCWQGWAVDGALDYLCKEGVVADKKYPYSPCNQAPVATDAPRTRVHTFAIIERDVPAAMWWLANRGPLITQFSCPPSFMLYKEGVFADPESGDMNSHVVAVMGYEDTSRMGEARGTSGHWICKNSFGTEWGEKGWFRIGFRQRGIYAEMWGVDKFAVVNGKEG